MEVMQLLDRAKEIQGIETDKALATALGVTKQAVSNWRKGVSLPDTVTCATLAGLTGIPLAQVLGIVGEARAISREEKAVWRKLAASAAVLILAFSALVTPAAKAGIRLSNQGITDGEFAKIAPYVLRRTVDYVRAWAVTVLSWVLGAWRDRFRRSSPGRLAA